MISPENLGGEIGSRNLGVPIIMGVSSQIIYEYNGSLASIFGGGVLNANLINSLSGGQSATITDDDGVLEQSDDAQATLSLDDGSVTDQPIDYIGSGTISTVTLLGIPVDSRNVAVFSANGQIYLIAPQGLPLLSSVSISFNIDAGAGAVLDPFMPCLLEGTLIRTPCGYRPIEKLKAGEEISDADGERRRIVWRGEWSVSAGRRKDRPVLVPAHFFGPQAPFADTWVSPHHRLVIRSPDLGPGRRLVRAKLLFECGLDHDDTVAEATYHHLLFDDHVVLVANGMETESLLLGRMARRALGADAWDEICSICPMAGRPGFEQPLCAPELTRGELTKLKNRHNRIASRHITPLRGELVSVKKREDKGNAACDDPKPAAGAKTEGALIKKRLRPNEGAECRSPGGATKTGRNLRANTDALAETREANPPISARSAQGMLIFPSETWKYGRFRRRGDTR